MPAPYNSPVARGVPFDPTTDGFPSTILDVQAGIELMGVRHQVIPTATSNSTLTLSNSTAIFYLFTGTTAGQIVNLGTATNYLVGRRYEIWNISTQTIAIKDAGSNSLCTVLSGQSLRAVLQDNTTSNGVWVFEFGSSVNSSGSKGTVANVVFAQPGISSGSYLRIGGNASNFVGYSIPTTTNISGIAISIQSAVSADTVIQLQNRSAVSTLADIAGASITILNGQYKAYATFALPIAAGNEICAYVKSGSLPGFSVCTVFVAP